MRRVFAPQVTVPGNHSTKAEYLTIHATEYSGEANLLNKVVLSKYDVLTLNVHALKHPVSSELPTAQKKSWCSAISNASKYRDTALSVLL